MEKFMKRPAGFSSVMEDLISNLPDALISQILLYLPTKEAVKTSVLSNRWKRVWLLIPGLDLKSNEFPSENVFAGFIEKFLDFSEGENSCLHKLKLSIRKDENDNKSCVTRWIDFVLTHKLKHLDIECLLGKRLLEKSFLRKRLLEKRLLGKRLPWKRKRLEVMPLSLYISQTLINLRLHRVSLGSFESVSLPCLKTMHLEQNVYANETCLASLISSCPVLEDLSIIRRVHDNVEILRVISQSLTSLSVAFELGQTLVFGMFNPGVFIDAPRLNYLKFKDEISRSKVVRNLDSLAKVEIEGDFRITRASDGVDLSEMQLARNFFIGISRVRHMIISSHARRLINSYLNEEPSTRFCNLSCLCLEAHILYTTGKSLSRFLECCPNLKSFIMDFTHSMSQRQFISFSSVPQCLLSSLEFVEIKSGLNITPLEIGVARCFVENSLVLKKLVVHLSLPMDKKSSVDFENLLALPWRSSMCEIVHVYDC